MYLEHLSPPVAERRFYPESGAMLTLVLLAYVNAAVWLILR